MVTGKQFYFPMDDRDSFIFLVIVGIRCMWSSTHLATQLSSCRFTCCSLFPASMESLALSLQCMVHRARRSCGEEEERRRLRGWLPLSGVGPTLGLGLQVSYRSLCQLLSTIFSYLKQKVPLGMLRLGTVRK